MYILILHYLRVSRSWRPWSVLSHLFPVVSWYSCTFCLSGIKHTLRYIVNRNTEMEYLNAPPTKRSAQLIAHHDHLRSRSSEAVQLVPLDHRWREFVPERPIMNLWRGRSHSTGRGRGTEFSTFWESMTNPFCTGRERHYIKMCFNNCILV